jgi:hypothetical protein
MANNQRPVLVSPTSCCCMHIRATYSTCNDFHIDIIISKWFWLKLKAVLRVRTSINDHVTPCSGTHLDFLRTIPLCCRMDRKPFESIWVHGEGANLETKVLRWDEVEIGKMHFLCPSSYFPHLYNYGKFPFTRLTEEIESRDYLQS